MKRKCGSSRSITSNEPQKRCVLLVDDAHNLSLRVFDEIRVLIDQTAAFSKQLSVGLFVPTRWKIGSIFRFFIL